MSDAPKVPYEFPSNVKKYVPKCVEKECPPPPKRSNTWYIILIIIIVLLVIGLIILAILYFTKGTGSDSASNTISQVGGSCTSNPCAVGLTCDLGICKPRIGTGPCNNNSNCPGASECISNVCKSTFNGSCSSNSDCAVATNICTNSRCENPPTCTTTSDCLNVEGPQTFCNGGNCITPTFVGQGDLCDNTTLYCAAPYSCVASVCL